MRYTEDVACYNSNSPINVSFDLPAICPICGSGIDPVFLHAYIVGSDFDPCLTMYVFYLCPRCKKAFVTEYNVFTSDVPAVSQLARSYPEEPQDIAFPDGIQHLSPKFIKIYRQASDACVYGLDEVAGIGFRKALEFLIKDYAIHSNPDSEDDIRRLFLSEVIRKYVHDDKIRTLAERASWLGNDETHYIRVFEDFNIDDLRKFIDALVVLINADLIFNESLDVKK